jgi:hypothetical protein
MLSYPCCIKHSRKYSVIQESESEFESFPLSLSTRDITTAKKMKHLCAFRYDPCQTKILILYMRVTIRKHNTYTLLSQVEKFSNGEVGFINCWRIFKIEVRNSDISR